VGKEASQAAAEGPRCAWTVKSTKARPSVDGAPRVDLAIPAFGYKNHLGIDRRHRLIRSWAVSDAARCEGALLPRLIDKTTPPARSGPIPPIVPRQ
jgi:hypothetical protein